MKLTWHIAQKDFRRLWPLLALWWGVLVLRALLPALAVNMLATMTYAMSYMPWGGLFLRFDTIYPLTLLGADILLLLIIGAAVVQTDSPVKPGAHWRALPLAGGRVLRSKILFLILFCGLPAAVINLAAKIAYRFAPAEWLAGLGWYEWKITACVVLGAMLASLFRRPLFSSIVVVVLYACLTILYDLPAIWYVQDDDVTMLLTHFLLWSNFLIATALWVVVSGYLRRRRWRSFLILAFGVACAQFVQEYWPFDFFDSYQDASALTPAPDSSPTFALKTAPLHLLSYGPNSRNFFYQFAANLTSPPSNHPAEVWILNQGRWALPLSGGKKMDFIVDPILGLPVNYAEVLQSFGLEKLVGNNSELTIQSRLFGPDVLNLLLQEQSGKTLPKLNGQLAFFVGQMTRVADVPLTPGATFPRTQEYYAIHDFHLSDDEPLQFRFNRLNRLGRPSPVPVTLTINMFFRSITPAGAPIAALDPAWSHYEPSNPDGFGSREYYFVLWNPKRREIIPALNAIRAWSGRSPDPSGSNEGNGLSDSIVMSGVFFDFKSANGPPWSNQEVLQWLADARLVELRFIPEHYYSIPITIDPLEIPDQAAPSAPTPPAP